MNRRRRTLLLLFAMGIALFVIARVVSGDSSGPAHDRAANYVYVGLAVAVLALVVLASDLLRARRTRGR